MTVARGGKRGKTAGRGGKGQSARAGNKRRPEWRDIIKKLPKLRGRGVNQNKPVSDRFVAINLSAIEEAFSVGEMVTPTTMIEKRVISTISGIIPQVKILGDGEVTKAFKISGCALSDSAKEKIEKVGGTIIALASRVVPKKKGPTRASDSVVVAKVEKKPSKEAKKPKAENKEAKK